MVGFNLPINYNHKCAWPASPISVVLPHVTPTAIHAPATSVVTGTITNIISLIAESRLWPAILSLHNNVNVIKVAKVLYVIILLVLSCVQCRIFSLSFLVIIFDYL